MRGTWLAALLAAGAALADGPAKDEGALLEEEVRRLKGLVADLESADSSKREDAAAGLLAAGGDAIPYVIDAIYRKDAKMQLQVLEKLLEQERAELPAELRLSDADFKAIAEGRLGDPKIAAAGREYLLAKYYKACEEYKAGRFQEALDLSNAILVLERGLDFRAAVQQLRIQCEEQQIQAWLVRTTASVPRPMYQGGELAHVTLTCTNMAAGPVEIWFGPKEGVDVPEVREEVLRASVVHVEIFTSEMEADGTFAEIKTEMQKPLNKYSIQLKRGESVRIAEFDVDTVRAEKFFCRMTVKASMRPVMITGPESSTKQRVLRFLPAEIKVFPGDLKKACENPLQGLCDAIDSGDANSAFLFCQLMPPEKSDMAVEPVMRILQDPKWKEGDRRIARNCLSALTGETRATDEKWLEWYRQRAKEPDGIRK